MSCGLANRPMELKVEICQPREVATVRSVDHAVNEIRKQCKFLRRNLRDNEGNGVAFEGTAQAREFDNVLIREDFRDERAAIRASHHESLLFEVSERFTYWRTTYLHRARNLSVTEARPGRDFPRQNGITNRR